MRRVQLRINKQKQDQSTEYSPAKYLHMKKYHKEINSFSLYVDSFRKSIDTMGESKTKESINEYSRFWLDKNSRTISRRYENPLS